MKSAQVNQLFKWSIIAIIIAVLPIIAFKAVNKIKELSCETELLEFEARFKEIGKSIKDSEVSEERLKRPCKVDILYIVDENVDHAKFDKYPAIKEKLSNIKNKGENVFLLENKNLRHSFYLAEAKISPPNYICADTRHGRIELLFEGIGENINIRHKDNRFNCGPIEVIQLANDAGFIKNEISKAGTEIQNVLPKDVEFQLQVDEAQNNADIYREITCPSNKEAQVQITLSAKSGRKLKEVHYIEQIDKKCLNELKNLPTGVKDISDVSIKLEKDPLIVWSFKTTKIAEEPITLKYTTHKCILDCKDLIKGILLAKKVFDHHIEDEVKKIENVFPPDHDIFKKIKEINEDIAKESFDPNKLKKLEELAKKEGKGLEEVIEVSEEFEEIDKEIKRGKGR